MNPLNELYQYTPVLKIKLGELSAVKELKDSTVASVFPLFELMPIPWDYETDKPAKTIDMHTSTTIAQISKHWRGRNYMLDLPYIDNETVLQDNNHPFEYIASQALEQSPGMIPVTGLDRGEAYNHALKEVVQKLRTGLALRLRGEDFDEDDFDINIEDTLAFYGLTPSEVDLIVDFGAIPPEGHSPFIAGTRSLLKMIPDLKDWRRLILIASSFPESMTDIPSDKAKLVSRGEWLIWKSLVEKGRIRRLPQFGDYTTVHPQPFEMDPRLMRLGAKIKYTTNDHWLLVKGRGVKSKGYSQFRELASFISQHKLYSGEKFSWGDQYIMDCANGSVGFGNQMTWVRVAVNHHIEYVVHQLSSFSVP